MKKLLICFSIMLLLATAAFSMSFQDELLMEVNLFRLENNLQPLDVDESLCLVARGFSSDMKQLDTFSHDIMTSADWNVMAAKYGVDRHCFELLVFSTDVVPDITKTITCLINSPEHREGLLMKDGVVFGVAVAPDVNCAYITIYIGGEDRRGENNE